LGLRGQLCLVERLDVEDEIGLDSADSHLLAAFEEEPFWRLGLPELTPDEDLAAAAKLADLAEESKRLETQIRRLVETRRYLAGRAEIEVES